MNKKQVHVSHTCDTHTHILFHIMIHSARVAQFLPVIVHIPCTHRVCTHEGLHANIIAHTVCHINTQTSRAHTHAYSPSYLAQFLPLIVHAPFIQTYTHAIHTHTHTHTLPRSQSRSRGIYPTYVPIDGSHTHTKTNSLSHAHHARVAQFLPSEEALYADTKRDIHVVKAAIPKGTYVQGALRCKVKQPESE
jgi:hypothetical protein